MKTKMEQDGTGNGNVLECVRKKLRAVEGWDGTIRYARLTNSFNPQMKNYSKLFFGVTLQKKASSPSNLGTTFPAQLTRLLLF